LFSLFDKYERPKVIQNAFQELWIEVATKGGTEWQIRNLKMATLT
jgi:hypothetical protein